MAPTVVIILINTNGYADTSACLQSILDTGEELPFVVVVDNASSEKIDVNTLHDIYPKLKIVKNETNIGFGKANNAGIQWAFENIDFDYLLILNNDTIVTKDSLKYLVDAFEIDPEIGITTSKIMYDYNRDLVWYGGGEINYRKCWPKIYDYDKNPTAEGADKSKYVNYVCGCVMMFSRACIEKIKGFDDDYFIYCEDLELSMRMIDTGLKMYYESRSVIYHKVQGSAKRKEGQDFGMKAGNPKLEFVFYHMKSNQWITAKKRYSKRQFFSFSSYYWPAFIYQSVRLLLKGRWDMFRIGSKTIGRIIHFAKQT
jgi:GT2 family glycosyltransferase